MSSVCFPKETRALRMLQDNPLDWFRNSPIDQRDLNLIRADRADWLDYSKASFCRKIYHMKVGELFQQTNWTVETDTECKKLVDSAGGRLVGFDDQTSEPVQWASATVNVNVTASPQGGFVWGYLSSRPQNIRIFKGPAYTCSLHPWDAMILRDCRPNTDNLSAVERVASRKWDILCMKMCEDYDSPWLVVAINDAGPRTDEVIHDCQDMSACGCLFAH